MGSPVRLMVIMVGFRAVSDFFLSVFGFPFHPERSCFLFCMASSIISLGSSKSSLFVGNPFH